MAMRSRSLDLCVDHVENLGISSDVELSSEQLGRLKDFVPLRLEADLEPRARRRLGILCGQAAVRPAKCVRSSAATASRRLGDRAKASARLRFMSEMARVTRASGSC